MLEYAKNDFTLQKVLEKMRKSKQLSVEKWQIQLCNIQVDLNSIVYLPKRKKKKK